jgi:hypothetical protein
LNANIFTFGFGEKGRANALEPKPTKQQDEHHQEVSCNGVFDKICYYAAHDMRC